MSETLKPTQEQAQEACAFMAAEVDAPAFFEKLASHGIQPRNQAEADQLLLLGAKLADLEQQGLYKSAAADTEAGNLFLQHVLGRLDAVAQPSQAQCDATIKSAATNIVKANPIAKAAALIYQHVASGGEIAEAQA